MKLRFLGGAGEVGRSCVHVDGVKSTLLDCGVMFGEQGKGEDYPLLNNSTVRGLDRAVISHAHLDHSGFAPGLYSMGFKNKVFLTKPTRDLMQLLLSDYLKLAKERGSAPYGEQNVNKLLQNSIMLEYDDNAAYEQYGVRLQHAGHIVGSALVELQDEKKLLYTGDLNLRDTRMLEPARLGLSAQILIIESTYGSVHDRHPSLKAVSQQFASQVRKILERGGKVIIPTFAVGRAQEVLFTLESYFRSRALPIVPIYLDGMVKKALKIYRHNAVYLKREIQLRILSSDSDPFKSEHFHIPATKDRSDVMNEGPCIILATGGMLTGGPILSYLRELGSDRTNGIIFVGYQGEGTPGRALLDGGKEMTIDGEVREINAEVSFAQFSAHSDHDQLVDFTKSVQGLEKVFVMHGEKGKSEELAADIARNCNKKRVGKKIEVFVPELGSEYDV